MRSLQILGVESSLDDVCGIIVGKNRNKDIGISINVPKGETVYLPYIEIKNVFIGVIKTGDGMLVFESDLSISDFGGDAINIRGSNLSITGVYRTFNNTPTRPYTTIFRHGIESIGQCLARNNVSVFDKRLLSWNNCNGRHCLKGYHQDTVLQAYAVLNNGYTIDNSGSIKNINIPSIICKSKGLASQNIICSEACEISGWNIGTKVLEIESEHQYPIIFNTIRDSIIGNENAAVSGKLIIKNKKGSVFSSKNNLIRGLDVYGDYENTGGDMNNLDIYQPKDNIGENISRGFANNNPGNIRPSNRWKWRGECDAVLINGARSGNNEYLVFTNPSYGIRAIAVDLINKQKRRKLKTVRQIISRYAPSSDGNNTNAYIYYICSKIGVSPNQIINLRDRVTLDKFVKAIIEYENKTPSGYFYKQEIFDNAYIMAGIPDVGEKPDRNKLSKSGIIKGTAITAPTITTGAIIKTNDIIEKSNEINPQASSIGEVTTSVISSYHGVTAYDWTILLVLSVGVVGVLYIAYDRWLMHKMGIK